MKRILAALLFTLPTLAFALDLEAKQAKRGLWLDKNPIPPWEWRRGRR